VSAAPSAQAAKLGPYKSEIEKAGDLMAG